MRKPFRYYMFWTLWVVITLIAHSMFRYHSFSLIPLTFLLSILVSVLLPKPLVPLLLLGVISELSSTAFPGINILIILIPWGIRRLFPQLKVELSFSLFLFLLGIVLLQIVATFIPDLISSIHTQGLNLNLLFLFPWRIISATIISTAFLSYILLLIWEEYDLSSASFTSSRRYT